MIEMMVSDIRNNLREKLGEPLYKYVTFIESTISVKLNLYLYICIYIY